MSEAATTRRAIGDAASELFNRQGYAATSVRAVAARAGADPALVIRYFGSKEALFLETVSLEGQYADITSGPLESLGERLVAALLTDDPEVTFGTYRALMRASDSDSVRRQITAAMEEMFVIPLAPRLSGPDAELRVRLIACQVSGLLDAVAILGDAGIVAASHERLFTLYGAAIQSLIDPPAARRCARPPAPEPSP